jgi:ABC-type Mn2+/Zn2+ transport system permease subunit
VSQASLLGVATGMWLASWPFLRTCSWCQSAEFLSLVGGCFAVLGALVTARGGEHRAESYEAVTGWVFLFASSLAILIVAGSPHGLEEVHRLLSSTIIGASRRDVEVFGMLAAATLVGLAHWRAPLLLLVMDPEMARAVGVRVGRWDRVLSICLGIAVGLSLRVAGMLYTFGCLVLPALIARRICREVRSMFTIAPLIALGASTAAFVLANHYDYPPGQVAVALLGGTLAAVWMLRSLGVRRTAL